MTPTAVAPAGIALV